MALSRVPGDDDLYVGGLVVELLLQAQHVILLSYLLCAFY
jgi:hypothetical protein